MCIEKKTKGQEIEKQCENKIKNRKQLKTE